MKIFVHNSQVTTFLILSVVKQIFHHGLKFFQVFVENSSFSYVAYDLRNNLEHANLTKNIYFAISQLQVYES